MTVRNNAAITTTTRGPGLILALAGAAAVVALVMALLLGGGRPQAAPDGLPDAGPVTGWALPLARMAFDAGAIGSIGCLLVAAVLVVGGNGIDGRLSPPARRATRAASWWAAGWCGATLAVLLLSMSDLVGLPVSRILSLPMLRSLPWTVPLSRSLVLTVVATLALAGLARWTVTRTGAVALLILAIAALLPVLFTGHAATAADHDLATSSLIVHVVAATLWVGGLLALLVYARTDADLLAAALPRFSTLALGCFVLVAFSGALSAVVRLGSSPQAWVSSYGALLVAKSAALVLLGWLGREHRSRTLPALLAGRPRAFLRLAGGEVVLMAAVVGLAVALGRTPAPALAGAVPHASRHPSLSWEVLPLSPARILTEWRPDAIVLSAVGIAAVAYLAAVRLLSQRGQRWPARLTASAMSGLAAATFALCGGLATYATALFSMQVTQLLVMATVVPVLLALGKPLTLIHEVRGNAETSAADPGVAHPLVRKAAGVLSNPVNGLLVLVSVLVGLYTTPLFEMSLRSFPLHLLANLMALAAGTAFFWPVLRVDALTERPALTNHTMVVAALFGLLAVFGAVLVTTDGLYGARWFDTELGWSWSDPVVDQRRGGAVVWAFALGLVPFMLLVRRVRSRLPGGPSAPPVPDHPDLAPSFPQGRGDAMARNTFPTTVLNRPSGRPLV
jgi:cytochrome c oxidase assembly factor CtaG